MKTIGSLLVILLIVFACMHQKKKSGDDITELTDTLKYRTIVLQVEGMTCEGCEQTITKTVSKLAGVAKVQASHLDSVTTVVFDTSLANVVVISESINELGYQVVGEIAPKAMIE